jgi:hypothetical protein
MATDSRLFRSRRHLTPGPARPPGRPVSRHRRALGIAAPAALAAVLAASAGGPGAASASAATTGLTATYHLVSSWGSGYSGEYILTNHGSDVTSWTLSFRLPAGTTITSMWNGFYQASRGKISVTPVFWSGQSWDGTIAAGQSLQIGFVTETSGAAGQPSGCLADGGPCAGGPAAAQTPAGGRPAAPASAPRMTSAAGDRQDTPRPQPEGC